MRNKQNFVVQPLTLIPSMSKFIHFQSAVHTWLLSSSIDNLKKHLEPLRFVCLIHAFLKIQSNVSRRMFVGLGYDTGKNRLSEAYTCFFDKIKSRRTYVISTAFCLHKQ